MASDPQPGDQSEIEKLRASIGAAKGLLACIHRDGGHHTGNVGFDKSCEDATARFYDLAADRDKWRSRELGPCEQIRAAGQAEALIISWLRKGARGVDREAAIAFGPRAVPSAIADAIEAGAHKVGADDV